MKQTGVVKLPGKWSCCPIFYLVNIVFLSDVNLYFYAQHACIALTINFFSSETVHRLHFICQNIFASICSACLEPRQGLASKREAKGSYQSLDWLGLDRRRGHWSEVKLWLFEKRVAPAVNGQV
jgi:hypothetical protein